jgi:hypothetical protein
VAADLDAVAGVAIVVGGVDDAGRQPQHPLLNRVQDGQVGTGADSGRPGPAVCHCALLTPVITAGGTVPSLAC